MTPRLDASKYMMSGPMQALLRLQKEVEGSGLERPLLELIKIRASQLNGCAYCIDMHTKDARARGETEQRHLRAERVARGAVLQRARTGGARVDGISHPRRRHARAGRGVHARPRPLRGG